jgi:hypothetical protein
MALVVLASASGSPGVTTTALGLALRWPRPAVLVDADPVGGSAVLAGFFRGQVPHNDAMVQLVLASRAGELPELLPTVLMPLPNSTASLLPGPRSHAQAASMIELWPELVEEFRSLDRNGQDVLVDAGRLGMQHSPTPVVVAADLLLLVCRSELPALAASRQWAEQWSTVSEDGSGPSAVSVLLVGEGRPYRAREVAKVLGAPVLETMRWDPGGAAVFSRGEDGPRRVVPTLWRDLNAVIAAIDTRIAQARRTPEGVAS